MENKKVLLGMSGGVDSSVSALMWTTFDNRAVVVLFNI